ncbi:hypothetical protein CSUI_006028 [Cystoisospora suis]|uniref:Uncharacterized protein n=1 Tax=Cystoisospora suis TaxID=483139 RepID=A0A2C6KVY3_9APIC|nr:hypothetical protein CSUI_006028 [Cystoisospora suis]
MCMNGAGVAPRTPVFVIENRRSVRKLLSFVPVVTRGSTAWF